MRPATNSTTTSGVTAAAAGIHGWNSPIPYLFGGLALMLGLIAVALITLACSYKKPSSDGDDDDHNNEEKTGKPMKFEAVDVEPRIVVIMAGDDMPTYLAKPIVPSSSSSSSSTLHNCDEQV